MKDIFKYNRDIEKEIIRRYHDLKQLVEEKRASIAKAPKGKLHFIMRNKSIMYYHREDTCERSGTYIRKKNIDLIRKLSQKHYDEKVLELLEYELERLESFASLETKTNDIRRVYSDMPEQMKKIIRPIDMSDDEYAKMWQEQPYNRKEIGDNVPEYYTKKGDRVRSKSEVIISDMLYDAGIPYKYESELYIQSGRVYPDFRVLNKRTREEKIWEHMGMMDDREYSRSALMKINSYERAGFSLGDTLILTFESAQVPLNVKQIENIINRQLK